MNELDSKIDDQIHACIEIIKQGDNRKFLDHIYPMAYADVAEAISDSNKTTEMMRVIFDDGEMRAGRICSYLDQAEQLDLFNELTNEEFARLFENMEPDIRVDLFQLIPEKKRKDFVRFLDHETVGDLFLLDSYHPDSAGGIMSTDFEAARSHMTITEVIEELRNIEHRTHNLFYVYVTDKSDVLLGRVSIRELLFADRSQKIGSIVKDVISQSHVDEDQEDVAKKFEKYDLYNIPVINDNGQLVGLISSDDIMDVIREEETEDFEKMMGISQEVHELPYLESSVASQFKKRFFWLFALTAVGLCSGLVVQHFQETLAQYVILTLFMPMIAATGGNVGSQSSSVMIRSLALDEISLSDTLKIIYKEFRIAALIACSLGTLTFLGVILIASGSPMPGDHHVFKIAETIALALSIQIISAIMFGTIFPLFVKWLKGDPALVASPAITTFVDITGLMIYFTVAGFMLF